MVKSVIIPFIVNRKTAFIVEVGFKKIRFYANHGKLIKNDDVYSVDSPYQYIDLFDNEGISLLQYVQNGDKLYLFHKKYPLKILSRYSNTDWRISDFEFRNGPWGNVNTSSISIRFFEESNTLVSTSSVFKKSDVGRLVRLTVVDSKTKHWQAEKDIAINDIVVSDNKYYKDVLGTKTGTAKPVHNEGIRSDGGVEFEYLHAGYGVVKITEYVNENSVKVLVLGNMPEEIKNNGTTYWELGLIHNGAEYPMCGTFFRNRFCFMLNDNGVPKVCLSCSDDYDNFADKDEGQILATNAITVPVTSDRYNEGRWLSSSNVLFAGTSSGEFYIDSAASSEAIAPDNVKIQQISSTGSRAITPVKIGAHIIFVTESGTSLRDVVYSFSQDSYDPVDLSLFGKHLIQSGITAMVYQENPDKILWMIVSDGRLIGLTFSSEQNVFALHQNYLGGKTEGIAVIPNPFSNLDELWLEVNRERGQCIEYIESFAEDTKENMFFVDGGLSFEGESFQGLLNLSSEHKTEVFDEVSVSVGEGEWEVIARDEIETDISYDRAVMEKLIIRIYTTRGQTDRFFLRFPEDMDGAKVIVSQVDKDDKVLGNFVHDIDKKHLTVPISTAISTDERAYRTTVTISNFYEKKERKMLYGLDHLEGKKVAIMVNGAERERQIVTNGGIEVWNTDKNITAGLPVESAYIPQTMYIQGNNGSGVGDVQRIDHITLMLWNSLGGKVGSNFEDLQDIYFRKTDDEMNKSAPLFTGNKTIMTAFNTTTIKEKGAKILIYNDSVFPMNILAIAPHFSTSGNGL